MRLIRWVAAVVGVLAIYAPNVSAQVVFNELLLRRSGPNIHANQIVELKNIGLTPVNVSGWVFCHQFQYGSAIPGNTTIPAGGLLVAHFGQAGSSSSTEIFFPGDLGIADISDLALYVNSSGFGNSANIRAFVQFGGHPGGGREDVAQSAGLWTSGMFIPNVPLDHSIELCATPANSPAAFTDQTAPTIGVQNGCGVSIEDVSWSKVKARFR